MLNWLLFLFTVGTIEELPDRLIGSETSELMGSHTVCTTCLVYML